MNRIQGYPQQLFFHVQRVGQNTDSRRAEVQNWCKTGSSFSTTPLSGRVCNKDTCFSGTWESPGERLAEA